MKKTNFVKVQGCLIGPNVNVSNNNTREDSWLRIADILEVCPLLNDDRIREEITKEEYDARPNDTHYGMHVRRSTTDYWKYYDSCRIITA